MSRSVLTSRGRTTIPKSIRDRLNLKRGDRLEFVLQADGRVLMIPATGDVRELRGILPKPKRKLSLVDMDRAVRDSPTRQKVR